MPMQKPRRVSFSVVVPRCWISYSRRCPKKGFVAVRIDGRKSLKDRKNALSRFKSDPTCTVMLVSIGSAGEGVDFTSATCVHLLEPHWNPMVEAQAVDRVHRIGQHRPVTTTRYVTRNSIETYVQWIQNSKINVINQSLSGGLDGEPRERLEDQRWKKLQQFLQSNPDQCAQIGSGGGSQYT